MNDWYRQTNSSDVLSQGDFLFGCPIAAPSRDIEIKNWSKLKISTYNVIVLSQSCDLENNKIDLVLVCPFHSIDEFTKVNPSFSDYKLRESARTGNMPGYHLLNSCPFLDHDDVLIVDFKTVFSVSFDFLKQFKLKTDKRIVLNAPYKEHLSQSFARFFMRVGLPSSIPRFKKKKK